MQDKVQKCMTVLQKQDGMILKVAMQSLLATVTMRGCVVHFAMVMAAILRGKHNTFASAITAIAMANAQSLYMVDG